jgi:hypothetical protein
MDRMAWESEADASFDEIAGHLNALHGRMVATAAWLLAHPTEWQGDGVWTPEAYVCWRTGVSRPTASKVVDVARRIDEFPHCVASMSRGELSLDQLVPIVRHAPAWCDRQMAGLAPRLTASQVAKVARSYTWNDSGDTAANGDSSTNDVADVVETSAVDGCDTDAASGSDGEADPGNAVGTDEVATIEPEDRAWYGWGDDGRFRLQLEVGADSGLQLEQALAECHDHLFHARTDTDSVSTLDAVLEMAERSISTVASPARRSRYRANIHVDATTDAVTDHRGRRIPAGPAGRITCDALASVVHIENGVPVSVGRSQHIVPDRTRRLVEHRDGGCRVPGCHSDRVVEAHHIIHWASGGRTDTANLLSLCPKHHRLHHQGRIGITGDADRPPGTCGAVEFCDRHRQPIRSSGATPIPPDHPPPPIAGHYEHPLNERLEVRWLHFNNDPDATRQLPAATASTSAAHAP